MKTLPLACLGLLLAVPAAAQDARVVTAHYDPSKVIRLNGRTGIQSTIEFGDAESIENVAVGDSAAWQVTPNKRASLLFVKPMAAPARSNMTVVTSKRTYLFDLVSSPKAPAVYVMRFSNPPAPPRPAAAPVQQAAAQPKPPEATPADLNFAWASDGARQLLPQRLFDDGKATWLAWARDVSMPAILVREPNGNEGPVNYTVKGDYVVVDGVPPQLVLRQGKLVATLTPAPRAAARAEPAPPLPALAQLRPTATRTASTQP